MKGLIRATVSTILLGLLFGCATNNVASKSNDEKVDGGPKRSTPVVPGRPARMYVMAAFRELDCSPLTPDIQVTAAPSKGDVSFKPNQTTIIQFSTSGQCVGQQVSGTGIYYTARNGQSGFDSFSISAASGTSAPTTKSFRVEIVE